MTTSRAPRSPYKKYGKAPYPYSGLYLEWKRAALSEGASSEKALELSCRHAKYVGVKHFTVEGQFANDCV